MKRTLIILFLYICAVVILVFPVGNTRKAPALQWGSTEDEEDLSEYMDMSEQTTQNPRKGEEGRRLTAVECKEFVEAAKRVIAEHKMSYDENGEIAVEENGGTICVTFPTPPLGPTVRGAGFAAKISMDARSKKVTEILVGR